MSTVHNHIHKQTIPKPALWGAFALMVMTLVLAAYSRHARLEEARITAQTSPPNQAIEEIRVTFEDRADGAIVVREAAPPHAVVSVVAPQTNGFVRGVLRGMFRHRKLESMSMRDASFRLAREADGHLTLTDDETGRRVDLDSFGPTNSASFATILSAGIELRRSTRISS